MSSSSPTNSPLVGLTTVGLREIAAALGQPAFRGGQLAEWLYRHCVESFEEMTNLGQGLRGTLADRYRVGAGEVVDEQVSRDGCCKLLIELWDGRRVETVVLPFEYRVAVCVSTQVGCPVRCPFCATGLSGYQRDLTAGEIVDQVLIAKRHLRGADPVLEVSHVIFMGMGEPLLNYDNTLKAVRLLNEEVGLGMRRMTISTVGIVPAIDRLAAEGLQLTLGLSLQAPDDQLRRKLVPISAKHPLPDLLAACRRYASTTGRRLTFEYVLLRGINDSTQQAREVARLAKSAHAAVNLIPYNPVAGGGSKFGRPESGRVKAFRQVLASRGVTVTERVERGSDIAGACGQLRARGQMEGTSQ